MSVLTRFIVILFVTLFSPVLLASAKPLLVFDGNPALPLPPNFRMTVPTGKNPLNAIGSAQFSRQQLIHVRQKIKGRLMDVDLRQESHGFINGLPISWYGPRNWANKEKTPQQIRRIEQELLAGLKTKKAVTVYTILKKSPAGRVLKTKSITILPKTANSERVLVTQLGVGYRRFFVPDHTPPTHAQARAFVKFIKTLPKNTWLYFHCRAGKGRTTTFMVMLNILRSSNHQSLSAILKHQAAIGGKNLVALPAKSNYKYPGAVERLEFLKWFYAHYKS